MKMYSIYDIAKHRLQWAKHLQRKNEELEAEVKRLREAIEYAIVHAENHDVIRVLDEVMKNETK